MADTTTQKPKITLYWLEKSRAQRIVWLLEECKGLDYNIKTYKRGEDKLAPKELKDIHPLGKSPVIKVEAVSLPEPVVLAESGAIMEYLCHYFAPHLVPKRYRDGREGQVGGETEDWLRFRFYMHYAEGSLMTVRLLTVFTGQIKNAPVPFFIKPVTRGIASKIETQFLSPNFKTHFSFLESQLKSSPGGGKYLCGGNITAADILMSFPLIALRPNMDATEYPRVAGYIKLLEENEIYLRSIKKVEEASGETFKATV